MLDKKSQAALEFLMSYGWTILVVLVAVGTLAYFGFFALEKPNSSVNWNKPKTCFIKCYD